MTDSSSLREDAVAIWQAGLSAVRSDALVRRFVSIADNQLTIGNQTLPLAEIDRIAIVGAGKAGAGMSEGLEAALGADVLQSHQVAGWVNVPAGCERELQTIRLHPARPQGVNEPTEAGVEGTQKILDLVGSLGDRDLCICLISGGGSALLPAPREISLADKQVVTRFLSAAGANIGELNTVRKQLSLIKGGGLARACQAGRLFTLIISDVIGDPLEMIASGPTIVDTSTPADALAVLKKFDADESNVPASIYAALRKDQSAERKPVAAAVSNHVIGNNDTAVNAAKDEAIRRGYRPKIEFAREWEGEAETVAIEHSNQLRTMLTESAPEYDCLITGGEPTVSLCPPEQRGKGGRNQQLVLAALQDLLAGDQPVSADQLSRIAFLSGGTDGEDGPTTAAGALFDQDIAEVARRDLTAVQKTLATNDAFTWFQSAGGLLETGPTDTNVCDLRVGVVRS